MNKKRTILIISIFAAVLAVIFYLKSRTPKFEEDKVGTIYVDKMDESAVCRNICDGKKKKLGCRRKEVEGNLFQWFFAEYEECTYLCLGDFSTNNGSNIPCEEQLDIGNEQ